MDKPENSTNPLTLIRRAMAKCTMAYTDVQNDETKGRAKLVLMQAKHNIEEAIKELDRHAETIMPEAEADTEPPKECKNCGGFPGKCAYCRGAQPV